MKAKFHNVRLYVISMILLLPVFYGGSVPYSAYAKSAARLSGPAWVKAERGDEQVSLSWKPIKQAESYTIRYGISPGQYSQTISASSDTYGQTVIPRLTNGTMYYFQIAALVNGERTFYSKEKAVVPMPGFSPKNYVEAEGSNILAKENWNKAVDGDPKTAWSYGMASDNMFLHAYSKIYLNGIQLMASSIREMDRTYTVYGRYTNTGEEQEIGSVTVHLPGGNTPILIDPIQVKPGWYTHIRLMTESETELVYIHEVSFLSDKPPVQNVKGIPGDRQVRLSWDPFPGAEQYRIDYDHNSWFSSPKQSVTVSKDAYTGYTLAGLNNMYPMNFSTVTAIVYGEEYTPSILAKVPISPYPIGDQVPEGTKVSATGYYGLESFNFPEKAIDGDFTTHWAPRMGYKADGTISIIFPDPVNVHSIQLPTFSVADIQIYGLQNDKWKDLGVRKFDREMLDRYEPYPVPPGEYEGFLLSIKNKTGAFGLYELRLLYNTN